MIAHFALQASAPADTMVTIPARDVVDVIFAVAAGSIAALCIALLVALVFTMLQIKQAIHLLDEARKEVAADPAIRSLRKIAENAGLISDSVKDEALKLTGSVSKVSDQLTRASLRMEERVEEFNALMEVVQQEAEGAFVDGAATARGVRTGLGNFRGGRRRSSRIDEDRPHGAFESHDEPAPVEGADAEGAARPPDAPQGAPQGTPQGAPKSAMRPDDRVRPERKPDIEPKGDPYP